MKPVVVERSIGPNTLRIETGVLAKQAHGAVLTTYGGTVVLTAVVEGDPRGDGDFFPLQVDYRERYYAAGKFPGGFRKREGPPSSKEILTMRLTDRPIRPLFPKGYINEVQIMSTVLASDRENDADILSMIGASAALHISDLPFKGPIASVRMGRVDGELVVLPTLAQLDESDLDLVVAGSRDEVCMIEGFAREMPESEMADAIMESHRHIQQFIEMQEELRKECGKAAKEIPAVDENAELFEKIKGEFYDQYRDAKLTEGKQDRKAKVSVIKENAVAKFASEVPEGEPTAADVSNALYKLERRVVRDLLLEDRRLDGRTPEDLRPLYSEVGMFERTHGSSVFQRGETQAMMIATLGSTSDEQKVDGLGEEYSKKFMLDYNFPPFCVGETRPIRGPGRREIGHGALAERSLKSVIPAPHKFPYTIRLVSEILESNGSSSMATVCAGTLCLMDAGVPIKDPVAGISIGLVKEDDQFKLLTDILGDEDHFGDMDFKVAGTQRGVTGIQLDLKVTGISEEIIRGALKQAKSARIEILKHLLRTLKRPRKEISPHAPRLLHLRINPEKIGMVIGPGGKTIRAIQESTGTQIAIEDDGSVVITGVNQAAAEDARNRVEAITEDIKIGRVYRGRVASVTDFGAFVEIAPGRDGLCHISELDSGYVSRVADVCRVGDVMEVKVIGIDDHDRVKLSRRALLEESDSNKKDEHAKT